ncbi:ataxin-3-like [Rhopilema esculentum]|uniref:ataxin-3-like n=1 Tax=Rhopilema esculentum TaxID=499914 RepID=UPI0031DE77CD
MELIFHEKQEGGLCAQHCLNSLLQGQYYNAVDLAHFAKELDEAERERMSEGDTNSPEYLQFMQQPSSNMDDSGFFSIQVICKALQVWGLDLVSFTSQGARTAREYLECNLEKHWITIRKLGNQWFNLDSNQSGPALVTGTYLSLFLAQLEKEGYSIFIVSGELPTCEADQFLRFNPIPANNSQNTCSKSGSEGNEANKSRQASEPAKVADAEEVRRKRMQYFERKQAAQTSKSEPDQVPQAPANATS